MSDFDYDVLVIGSGFGGAVTALRLVDKGDNSAPGALRLPVVRIRSGRAGAR